MSHIKITSKDGVANSTEVTLDGKRIAGVTKIEIHPITARGDMVEATIHFELVSLDIDLGDFDTKVDDVFMNEKIKAALVE